MEIFYPNRELGKPFLFNSSFILCFSTFLVFSVFSFCVMFYVCVCGSVNERWKWVRDLGVNTWEVCSEVVHHITYNVTTYVLYDGLVTEWCATPLRPVMRSHNPYAGCRKWILLHLLSPNFHFFYLCLRPLCGPHILYAAAELAFLHFLCPCIVFPCILGHLHSNTHVKFLNTNK